MKYLTMIVCSLAIFGCGQETKSDEKISPVVLIEPSESNCNEKLPVILEQLKDEVAIDSFLSDCDKYAAKKKAMSFSLKTTGNNISNY